MNKPQDFDTTPEYSGSKQLPAGGYVCKIMKVEETTAQRTGAQMLKISLEIAEGEYKNFYADKYRADTRTDKKWGCVANQLVYDSNGGNTTNRGFKSFITCAEKSNNGFKTQWGNNFAACFKDKLIGVIFRREQYIGNDGNKYFSTKPAWFRSADEIRAGVPVPEDKLLPDNTGVYAAQAFAQGGTLPPDMSDFTEVPVPDGELPF